MEKIYSYYETAEFNKLPVLLKILIIALFAIIGIPFAAIILFGVFTVLSVGIIIFSILMMYACYVDWVRGRSNG